MGLLKRIRAKLAERKAERAAIDQAQQEQRRVGDPQPPAEDPLEANTLLGPKL
jgi:hypothetical protein